MLRPSDNVTAAPPPLPAQNKDISGAFMCDSVDTGFPGGFNGLRNKCRDKGLALYARSGRDITRVPAVRGAPGARRPLLVGRCGLGWHS